MIEKRKYRRFPVAISLHICDLLKQDTSGIHHLDSPIEVTNISENGVGFTSECILPLHYYFTVSIASSDGRSVDTTIRILRCDVLDHDRYSYGCEFAAIDDETRKELRKFLKQNGL